MYFLYTLIDITTIKIILLSFTLKKFLGQLVCKYFAIFLIHLLVLLEYLKQGDG